jgi:hypothetical protein
LKIVAEIAVCVHVGNYKCDCGNVGKQAKMWPSHSTGPWRELKQLGTTKRSGRRLNRTCQGTGERRKDGAGRPAHKNMIADLCCSASEDVVILSESRNRRSTARVLAYQSRIKFQGTSKDATSNGFGCDLDRITRRDDLRSGENVGGESLVLCDGTSRRAGKPAYRSRIGISILGLNLRFLGI